MDNNAWLPENNEEQAEIWAVGGGKGGTGKTFTLCQLAINLALLSKKVILIDTDFGGANVHSFFNIKKAHKSLNLFFEDGISLPELLVDTEFPNIRVITGDHNSFSSENIKYTQKMKLLRHVKKLEADYILLDLGGGSNYNTIDIFLLADRMITVTNPEITAIENLFHFIKNTYFRKLNFLLGIYGLKNSAKDLWKNRQSNGIKNIPELIEQLKDTGPDSVELVVKELAQFNINIILNKVRNSQEALKGFSIKSLCIKHLGIEALYSGFIGYDESFWRNMSIMQTSTTFRVSPRIKKETSRVTENIINEEQMQIGNIKHV